MSGEFDRMIKDAVPEGFYGAGTLLRFAAGVFRADLQESSTWVVLRAINAAEQELHDAVDCGDDMNVVEGRMAAIRLRVGIGRVRDIINARKLADDAIDAGERGDAGADVPHQLEAVAKACFGLWSDATASQRQA